jgi:Zn-ribbon protein, possibly nucleic acid-binding
VNAPHEDQLLLLDLQGLDQRASKLRHQRDSHPAHATLQELSGRAEDLRRAAITQGAVISDITREVTRIEDDIEKVRARRELQQGRLDRNEVPLRDMNPMEHEIKRMDQRLSDLEDTQLEAMERLESAEAAEQAMRDEAAAISVDVETTRDRFTEEMSGAEEELREVLAAREALAARVPAGILSEYERSRSRNGALAVIEVRDGNVLGAATELSPAELEDIRRTPADQLCWAEETSQLIVRTSAS